MYHIKRSPRYIIKEKKQWAEYCEKEVEGNNIYTYLLIKAQVISGTMQKKMETVVVEGNGKLGDWGTDIGKRSH